MWSSKTYRHSFALLPFLPLPLSPSPPTQFFPTGHCYRLYSSAVFNDRFNPDTAPEIVNRPIEDVVLTMKAMQIEDVRRFPFPTPPSPEGVDAALATLVGIGALDQQGHQHTVQQGHQQGHQQHRIHHRITTLGTAISKFPVAARYAKMLLLASQQKILPYAIAMVAGMTVQPPFLFDDQTGQAGSKEGGADGGAGSASNKRHKGATDAGTTAATTDATDFSVHDVWKHNQSDALSLLRAIGAYSHMLETTKRKQHYSQVQATMRGWCRKHRLHDRTMREISSVRRTSRRTPKKKPTKNP